MDIPMHRLVLVVDPRPPAAPVVYNPLEFIACPGHMSRGHAMTPRMVYTLLGVIVSPHGCAQAGFSARESGLAAAPRLSGRSYYRLSVSRRG